MSRWTRRLTVPHFSTSLSFSLRYCVTHISRDPLVRPLQHTDGMQQPRARLPKAPACCWVHLALFLVLDSAPPARLEQLQHRRGRNKLLCVLDGSDRPVACLHHLSVHFLSGPTCPGDDLLLRQAALGSETGREKADMYVWWCDFQVQVQFELNLSNQFHCLVELQCSGHRSLVVIDAESQETNFRIHPLTNLHVSKDESLYL